MTMTDFRARCFELLEWAEFSTSHYYKKPDVIIRARAALTEQPVEPTDEELLSMRSWSSFGPTFDSDLVDYARAVLARWGQPYELPTTQPIPVSERLPQAEDCDAENQCWWFSTETETQWSKWTYFRGTGAESHWLPANALPTPRDRQ